MVSYGFDNAFLWPCVILTVLITYKPAAYLTSKLTQEGDSFRAVISLNILSTVFLMSIILTVVGSWIGLREIFMEPIANFFYKWPRNFTLSLVTELIVVQPIARKVMFIKHKLSDTRSQEYSEEPKREIVIESPF